MDNTTGCNTCTPLACAMAPTTNGKTHAPPLPNAAAKPMAPTCRCLGRSFVAATTAAGKRGPRKKPRRATATAETRKCGRSQKISSRAMLKRR